MNSFYNFIIDQLSKFEGVYDRFIAYTPYLFRLLCDLMKYDIDKEDKRKINSALAYFVLPNDSVPEHLYGPVGYTDDLFVCTTVIKELLEKYGNEMLEKCWHNDDDLQEAVETCYEKSREFLEGKGLVKGILEYIGL